MKCENFFLFFSFLFFSATLYSQCPNFAYSVDIVDFDCDRFGEICVNYNPYSDNGTLGCINNGYLLRLSYPRLDFSGYTPLIDYNNGWWVEQNGVNVPIKVWESELHFTTGGPDSRICLEGALNNIDAEITLEVVNPNTNDVFSSETFRLRGDGPYGSTGQTTLLSTLIGNGDLLPAVNAQTQTQQVYLDGTIVVDVDYWFGSGGSGLRNHITMGENAKIIVESGRQLRFSRASIGSCTAWEGIELSADNNSTVAFSSSEVRDAVIAVRMSDETVFQSFNTVFRDNNIGIYALGTPDDLADVTLDFSGINFAGTAFLDGQIGIELAYTDPVSILNGEVFFRHLDRGIQLFGSSTALDLFGGYFEACRIGINSHSSANVRVTRSTFLNCEQAGINGAMSALSVASSMFSGEASLAGINRSPSFFGPNEFMSITNECEFDNTYDITGSAFIPMESAISDCYFRGREGNIQYQFLKPQRNNFWTIIENEQFLTDLSGIGSNIRLRNFSNTSIDDNLSMFAGGSNVFFENGERCQIRDNKCNSETLSSLLLESSIKMLVGCNQFSQSRGFSGGAFTVLGNNGGSTYQGNTLSGTSYDLKYGGLRRDASVGQQLFRGNEFSLSSPTNSEAVHFGANNISQNLAIADLYAVSSLNNRGEPKFPYSSPMSWFDNSFGVDDFGCAESEEYEEEVYRDQAIEAGIAAIITREDLDFSEGSLFDLRLNLYRNLEQKAALDSIEGYFSSALGAREIGQLVEFEREFEQVLVDFWAPITNDGQKITEITTLDSVLAVTLPVELDTVNNVMVIDSALLAIYNVAWLEQNALLQSVTDSLNHQPFQEVLNDLALQLPTGPFETEAGAYLADVFGIMVDRMSPSFESYTTEQLDFLNFIAFQCPDTEGEAVFWGRAMLGDHFDTYLAFEDNCEKLQGLATANSETESMQPVRVFPNPASGQIIVELPATERTGEIHLVNIQGQTVLTQKVNQQSTFEIDLKSFPAGTYWLTDAERKWREKVIIIH